VYLASYSSRFLEPGLIVLAASACTRAAPAPRDEAPALRPPLLPTAAVAPSDAEGAHVVVGCLREVASDATCTGTGGIFTYAETNTFRIYVCADKADPNRPRYYRSRRKDGGPGLDLIAVDYDPWLARAFVFRNNGYAYRLMIPQGAVEPALVVESPGGRIVEETVTRYLALANQNATCAEPTTLVRERHTMPGDPDVIDSALPPDPFFPPEIGAFRSSWYGKHLEAMGEPSLLVAARNGETALRVLWLRTFHNPISVRLELAGGAGANDRHKAERHGWLRSGDDRPATRTRA
jgi:hypothetical protein